MTPTFQHLKIDHPNCRQPDRLIVAGHFESFFFSDFNELYKESEFELIVTMFDFLEVSKNVQFFAEAFFSRYNRKDINTEKKKRIDRIFQILYPILSKKMRSLLPPELACDDQLLMQEIEQSPPLSTFIISKARKTFFDLDRVIKLLKAIKDTPIALDLLCGKILENRDVFTQSSGEWNESIQDHVLALFSRWNNVYRSEILMQALRLEIPLINLEDSGNDVKFAKMMQDISTTHQEAMTYLIKRMYSDPYLFPESAKDIFKGISNYRRFPDHFYIMIEIACAQTKEELFSLAEASEEELRNDLMYINDLWKQSQSLDDVSRKCFAIVLIEAIKHCLGEQALDTNPSYFSVNNQSLMTVEAQLLENKAPQSNPINEMLSLSI